MVNSFVLSVLEYFRFRNLSSCYHCSEVAIAVMLNCFICVGQKHERLSMRQKI